MSGIEVAGLVLGAIPLIIAALEKYKTGKDKLEYIIKWRGRLDDLLHQLKSQKLRFYLDIRKLLQEACVPAFMEQNDPDEETCAQILFDARTGRHIQDFLGHLFDHFIDVLNRYEDCLKTILGSLRGIVRLPRDSGVGIDAIANIEHAANTPISMLGRVKFAMGSDTLKSLIKSLKTEEFSIKDMVEGGRSLREYQSRDPTSESARAVKHFDRLRSRAVSLGAGLSCFGEHGCSGDHKARIRLEHRIALDGDKSRGLIDPARETGFSLLIAGSDNFLQEVIVTTPMLSDSQASCNPVYVPSLPGTPGIVITGTASGHSQSLTICRVMRTQANRGMALRLDLVDDRLAMAHETSKAMGSPNPLVSLSEYLRQTHQDKDRQMTPKQQKTLALSIASSILQLYETVWCSPSWDSLAIRLAMATTHELFVEQILGRAKDAQESDIQAQRTRASILELAILFLEICNLESLEMWAGREGYDLQQYVQFDSRFLLAIKWFRETPDRYLTVYDKNVIEYCLAICSSRDQSWQSTEFRQKYYENIIKQLKEAWKTW